MSANLPPSNEQYHKDAVDKAITTLTPEVIEEIALYTIQKINNYPKSLGKTVENYFDLLFPDEVKNHLIQQDINQHLLTPVNSEKISAIQQVKELRGLCTLMVERQEVVLHLISDKLDEMEKEFADSVGGGNNDKK